ncbi:MAG: MBL fold metallo-hydrolase [Flavobacteriaceae bacterium]
MGSLRAAVIPVTPYQQNCSLFWDEDTKRGVVIDPGGDVDQIQAAIEEQGIQLDGILLTHGHLDHAGGAADMRDKYNVKITGPHLDDKMLLDNLDRQAASAGIGPARNVTPDTWLKEGDTVDIAGRSFEVLHCPGHSPGSVVFVSKELNFAIVGDVLFAGSIGRTDLPGGDHAALINAIKTKLLPLDDEMGFLCGHGPGSTIGQERATNPFLR